MFDDRLLEAYMQTFNGFGNYHGPYWFVGMEHGGGGSTEEIIQQFTTWDNQGETRDGGYPSLQPGKRHKPLVR